MSTKTIFKRVALVAVAALGIGMLSAIPSNAAPSVVDGALKYSAGTQIIGGQMSILITLDTNTIAISNTVASTGVGTIVGATVTTPGTGAGSSVSGLTTTGFTAIGAVGQADAVVTAVLTSTVVGTQTITITPVNNIGVPQTAVTKTITWISGATDAASVASNVFISATLGSAPIADDASITTATALSATSIARIDVTQFADAAKTIQTAAASSAAVVVSISGAGSVQSTQNGPSGSTVTLAAGGASKTLPSDFWVASNNVAGTGTITITIGGVLVATKTVTFTGTFAAYKFGTPSKTVTGIGAGYTDVVAVSGLDSNGNVATIPGATTASSSNTAVATVSGTSSVIVTGQAVGTAVITVANNAVLASATITKTFTVTVGKNTAKTVTLSTDKTSYAAGEKVILTVTAVGSDGTATADAATTFLAFSTAGLTSNVALQGFPTLAPLGTVPLVGGVATYTIYAPLSDGIVTISATEGTSIDHVAADSTTAAVISTSFDAVNAGSSAAVDAANAATDAANYAADAADAATTAAQEATAAAQAAQDSADAATAAVVALGLRVDSLMASVRAQLTSLSNLLVRLIKKAHA